MKIRKALVSDVESIYRLINDFAKKEEMLPRSLNELYENVRDFYICEDRGNIIGACALHILWKDLAEIRSLAVLKDYQRRGIGRNLVKKSLQEAKKFGIKRVFALTYNLDFFISLGFRMIDKSQLPQKIWGDCLKCPRFPECDEDAVIMNLDNK